MRSSAKTQLRNVVEAVLDRFYDPTTGQFLSRDPANALTRSAYGYVGNNPLNGVDPSGLFGIPGTDLCVDIMDDSCHSNADGESLRDTPGRVSEVCQTYCDDVSNYASIVAAGAAFLCPVTAVSCAVAPVASGISVGFSLGHTVTTCLDGFDDYCARSAFASGTNIAFAGAGNATTKALAKCGSETVGSANVIGQLAVGDNGLITVFMNTQQRPDTYQRHPSHTDPEPE